MFSALLGWIQGAVREMWSLVEGGNASSAMQWVLDHWGLLLAGISLAGVTIDLVVYLLRWQPWRVWRSFLAGFRREKEQDEPAKFRKWVYADGSTRIEPVTEDEDDPIGSAVRRARRAPSVSDPDAGYNKPYYPPQWQKDHDDEPTKGIH